MAQEVTVKIKEDGSILFDYNGFEGNLCREKSGNIQAVLEGMGVSVKEDAVQMKDTKRKQEIALQRGLA